MRIRFVVPAMPLLAFFVVAQAAPERLLLKEIVVAPTQAEYIAIFNPNATAVALGNYYLADYETYYDAVAATPAASSADFVVLFPPGAIIAPQETQYVSVAGAECFYSACGSGSAGQFLGYGIYPTCEIASSNPLNNNALVQDMFVPFSNAVGNSRTLGNGGEPVMLFYWDGVSSLVTDIDYVYYGASSPANPGVDKTGHGSYLPDTADSSLLHAPLTAGAFVTTSTCRKDFLETGQTASTGNGVGGADETSEPSSVTWRACQLASAPDRVFADGSEG